MALEVKLKNLVLETLNTENVSEVIFGNGAKNANLDAQNNPVGKTYVAGAGKKAAAATARKQKAANNKKIKERLNNK